METRPNAAPSRRPTISSRALCYSRRALLLLGLVLLSACSVTIGAPAPTPGPNEPTQTPIEQVHFDVTPVPSPTPPPATATPGPLPPGTTPGAGGTVKYTIKPGDTLSGIAQQFNITVDDIVKANNIPDPNNIQAGEVLTIPVKGSAPAPSIATSTAGPKGTPTRGP